jgi:ABC-type nitrate/sulfonate/bicarbonate transport system permease component
LGRLAGAAEAHHFPSLPGVRFVSRSSWFAIRVPLAPRRATLAKFGAFLIPLAAWSLLSVAWKPDILVTDQGDGPYKRDDTVPRADFEKSNEKIRSLEAQYRVTEGALKSMRAEGVPASVIAKLDPVKGQAYADQKEFLDAIRDDFEKSELKQYQDILWKHLDREGKKEMAGTPSSPIWLPSPRQVALAFYHAFVTPPPGTGFKLTDESMTSLHDHRVPQAVLDKLKPLQKKLFLYSDRDKFQEELGRVLSSDELAHYQKPILKYAYVKGDAWLHESLWHSCQIIFWGFLLSAVVGVPLGILCGTFDIFSKLNEPFIDFIRYMPAPAFGVLCAAILGIEDGPKIAIIWIGTFFQMVLVVANTTRQFDEGLLEAAQTLGATKRSLLLKVILPGILPSLYNDMRILLGWAWTYLIVAEVVGASSGISFWINQQGRYRHFENVYAGIIMIGLIGLTCDQILATIARFIFPWVPRREGSGAWAGFFAALAALFGGRRKVVSPGAKA